MYIQNEILELLQVFAAVHLIHVYYDVLNRTYFRTPESVKSFIIR
jgi:hypothetical protein